LQEREEMAGEQGKRGQVLVTVGTTLFDALVEEASSQPCRQALADLGYSSLVIQRGKGSFTPVEVKIASLGQLMQVLLPKKIYCTDF